MQTTYEGLGGVDEKTRADLEDIMEQYLHALGFSTQETHVFFTVKTHNSTYTVDVELQAYGRPLCAAKAHSTSLYVATVQAADRLASHMMGVLTRAGGEVA